MMEEFLTQDVKASDLEAFLNQCGKDGWLIVNCWPSSVPDRTTCILRRQRVFFSKKTKRYEHARPLAQLTLPALQHRCLEERKVDGKDYHSLPLMDLALEHACTEEELFQHLISLGLKKSDPQKQKAKQGKEKGKPKASAAKSQTTEAEPTGESYSSFVNNHQVWIYRSKPGAVWVLYVKPLLSPLTRKKETGMDTDSGESATFSIDEAVKLCMATPPKQAGKDYGILLSTAAKAQNVSQGDALQALQKVGLPSKAKSPYVEYNGHQIALRLWEAKGVWYFNVKWSMSIGG
jgi:hypothetical protein